MYYVMFSRCSCLENIFLDENVDLEKLFCDPKALEEKLRLDKESLALSLSTDVMDLFYINIRSFSKHQKDLLNDPYAMSSKNLALVETWINPSETVQHDFVEIVSGKCTREKL